MSAFLRHAPLHVEGACLRSAALVDGEGVLAAALLGAEAVELPFASAVLAVCEGGGAVSPRMLLAAFNLALVGVAVLSAPDHVLAATAHLRLKEEAFVLTHTAGAPLLPCAGVAIVRAIDTRRKFFLLIPANGLVLTPEKSLVIVKSNIQLPAALLHSPGQLCHAYLTGETQGEGGAAMSARTNLKRRWHSDS